MNRRRFLTVVGMGVGMSGLSGCTSGGDNGEGENTATDTATATPTNGREERGTVTDENQIKATAAYFGEFLTSEYNLDVKSSKKDGNTLLLEYRTEYNSKNDIMNNEAGSIAGAYAGFIDAGLDTAKLRTNIYAKDDHQLGRFKVQTQWAKDFLKDNDSMQYAEQVRKTFVLDGLAKILDHHFYEEEYSSGVRGKVKNLSGGTLDYLEIRVKYYDESGAVVGEGLDNITNIEDDAVWKFETTYTGDSKPAEYEVEWGV